MATCSVFFSFAARAIEEAGLSETQRKSITWFTEQSGMAGLFAQKLETAAGRQPEVLELRIKLLASEMMNEVQGQIVKYFRVIADRYGDWCRDITSDYVGTLKGRGLSSIVPPDLR